MSHLELEHKLNVYWFRKETDSSIGSKIIYHELDCTMLSTLEALRSPSLLVHPMATPNPREITGEP